MRRNEVPLSLLQSESWHSSQEIDSRSEGKDDIILKAAGCKSLHFSIIDIIFIRLYNLY